ncbi:MAG: VWA domain-containing protein [Hormoscilla sp. SP5CHS1]|nr:VWA domain-containing protein [Hormoscilla sp. SP12CHS1]MBC6455527.1 VWA domain-containing protein [Hormoscilla sp. SP5CHS1]
MESTKITSVIRRIILSLLLVNALSSPAQALVEKVEITQKPVVDRNSSTVTLRVKVTGKNNKPVPLEEQDFSLKINCNSRRYNCQEIGSKEWKDWKNPKEAKPPPAFIIVLLDFSGSMKGTDSGGRTKYAAAIQAIRGFVDALSDRGPDTELAIVPFGGDEYSGSSCPYDKLISSAQLNRFFYVTDEKHSIHLDNLEDRKPCAQTTNLYGSLSKAVRLLGNSDNSRFHPEEEENEPPKPQPKLSIIMLSDGYHTADSEAQEEEEFQDLMRLLERDEEIGKITIHTLGYGRKPEYLQREYGLSRPATRQDVRKHAGLENEFVDRERLQPCYGENCYWH